CPSRPCYGTAPSRFASPRHPCRPRYRPPFAERVGNRRRRRRGRGEIERERRPMTDGLPPEAAANGVRPNARNRYRAQFEFANGVLAPETLPTALQFALNNSCNFKCVYCTDHRAGNDVPRTQLVGRAYDDVIAAIPRADLLAFHGINEFFIDTR